LGLDADGVHLARARVDRHDRRLRQHDAAAADVHERVRGAEVYSHVTSTETGEIREEAHEEERARAGGPSHRRALSVSKGPAAEMARKHPLRPAPSAPSDAPAAAPRR